MVLSCIIPVMRCLHGQVKSEVSVWHDPKWAFSHQRNALGFSFWKRPSALCMTSWIIRPVRELAGQQKEHEIRGKEGSSFDHFRTSAPEWLQLVNPWGAARRNWVHSIHTGDFVFHAFIRHALLTVYSAGDKGTGSQRDRVWKYHLYLTFVYLISRKDLWCSVCHICVYSD